jgi:predicted oxidoreductase
LVDELFAIGEVAEFGDGRYYGYNALEGTFLGRCLCSGLNAGQTAKDK